MLGHHARLRDVTSQSYPIHAVLVLITRVIHWSKLAREKAFFFSFG